MIVPIEAFDELNAVYSQGDHVRSVGPIVQRASLPIDRRRALRKSLAARFGIDFDRLVVTLLGAGVAADRSAQIQAVCGAMARRSDVLHLVVVWPTAVLQPAWHVLAKFAGGQDPTCRDARAGGGSLRDRSRLQFLPRSALQRHSGGVHSADRFVHGRPDRSRPCREGPWPRGNGRTARTDDARTGNRPFPRRGQGQGGSRAHRRSRPARRRGMWTPRD